MPLKTERRRNRLADSNVQGALLKQLVSYWLLGSVALVTVTLLYRVGPAWLAGVGDPLAEIWRQVGPVLVVSAAIAPMVIISALRFSNRFVGPMVRFRRALNQLAQGESPDLVTLRANDYWSDVAADINEITARMAKSTRQTAAADSESCGEPEQVAGMKA